MEPIKPYLVNEDPASGRGLIPLPVRNKAYDESWLQELLFLHPSLLPIDQIDESYLPLVSIGREITYIDNLFVSPSGLLTIVETKLWRNPEAHRTVIVQILEYAKTLSTWNYMQLDNSVKQYMKKRTGSEISVYQAVNKAVRNLSINEIEFQSKVEDSLKNGQFALVIVGDKVFPQATQLAETIQSAPHLQFSLGFIELSCYKLEKDKTWPLIIVPNFITKTTEVTRAVVRVIYEEKKPEVVVAAVQEAKTTSTNSSKMSEPVFFASLPDNVRDIFMSYLVTWRQKGFKIEWGKISMLVKVPWLGKHGGVVEANQTQIGIFNDRFVNQCKYPAELYRNYKEILMQSSVLGTALQQKRAYLNYTDIDKDDVMLILQASDNFADELVKRQ